MHGADRRTLRASFSDDVLIVGEGARARRDRCRRDHRAGRGGREHPAKRSIELLTPGGEGGPDHAEPSDRQGLHLRGPLLHGGRAERLTRLRPLKHGDRPQAAAEIVIEAGSPPPPPKGQFSRRVRAQGPPPPSSSDQRRPERASNDAEFASPDRRVCDNAPHHLAPPHRPARIQAPKRGRLTVTNGEWYQATRPT